MKILIFGNGISIEYTNNLYNNKVMKERFEKFLNYTIENDINQNKIVFSGTISNELKNILLKPFNESTFFEIYKLICLKKIKAYNQLNNIVEIDEIEVWNNYYESIVKNDESLLDDSYKYIFETSYLSIATAIALTICINDNFDNWIKINYENSFLNHLYTYDKVYTTNYYVDNLENISFLHGKIELKDKNEFNLPTRFDRRKIITKIISDSLLRTNSQILFGSNYYDKVFLRTVLVFSHVNSLSIKRFHPCFNNPEFNNKYNNFLNDSEVDIVGLSTEGDKHIIEVIKNKCKVINIYCNSEGGYKKWEQELSDYKGNKNFFCPHEYKGFENEQKCIGLCKKYGRSN